MIYSQKRYALRFSEVYSIYDGIIIVNLCFATIYLGHAVYSSIKETQAKN